MAPQLRIGWMYSLQKTLKYPVLVLKKTGLYSSSNCTGMVKHFIEHGQALCHPIQCSVQYQKDLPVSLWAEKVPVFLLHLQRSFDVFASFTSCLFLFSSLDVQQTLHHMWKLHQLFGSQKHWTIVLLDLSVYLILRGVNLYYLLMSTTRDYMLCLHVHCSLLFCSLLHIGNCPPLLWKASLSQHAWSLSEALRSSDN